MAANQWARRNRSPIGRATLCSVDGRHRSGLRDPRRIGAILALLVVTWPLLAGYAVAVTRSTFRGDPAPPTIEEWAPILRDGAIATAIGLAAGVPVLVIALLAGWTPGGSLSVGGSLAVAVVALGSAYVLPAALLRFAHQGTLVAGLDLWTVLDVILMPAYGRTWLAVVLASGAVVGALAVPTLIDLPGVAVVVWVLGSLLGYAVLVYAARAFGATYAEIMRLETDETGLTRRSTTD